MSYELEDDEYALVLRPFDIADDGSEDMQMSVGMSANSDNEHSEETQNIMYYTMTLLAAAFELINTDTAFFNTVRKKRDAMFTKEEDDFMDDIPSDGITVSKPQYVTEGNVIKLTQFTKTKGNA